MNPALDEPCCPLCGAANQCAAARTGGFDTPCWCEGTTIDAAQLARLTAAQRDRACLCAVCAAAGAAAQAARDTPRHTSMHATSDKSQDEACRPGVFPGS